MRFDVKCVRDCLTENGIVYSVRSYLYDSGWCKSDFTSRWLKRILMKEVAGKDDLGDYVKLSGFGSVDEWWRVIEGFCGGKRKWLYVVFVTAQSDAGTGA